MKWFIASVLLASAIIAPFVVLPIGRVVAQVERRQELDEATDLRLVFDRNDLPSGQYYDIMPPLGNRDRERAARIVLEEVRKYPAGYLKSLGLKYIGIFAGCAAKEDDSFRPYDPALGGYRYYGIWNGRNAIVAAFYTDHQLPLTLHHEIFHNIDAQVRDDGRFADAVSGLRPYAAPNLPNAVLAKLRSAGRGSVLKEVVSDYCRKNMAEDKAETARYVMSHLADALVQTATQPTLPGSQRILHVLASYERAGPERSMNIDWFVAIALDRRAVLTNGFAEPTHAAEVVPLELRRSAAKKNNAKNSYLKNVDAAIGDERLREAIYRVQPACVRLDNASGVTITADGHILTAAHVASRIGKTLTAHWPDGRELPAKCVAIDPFLDLAVLSAKTDRPIPFAPLAPRPPVAGTRVVCIGQPGSTTPSGRPTHYKAFAVSTGQIRELMEDPLGDQSLGRVSHDAWTYWGHSGSPLFDESGRIVAMHNSWDSKTTLRHAVPYEAIVNFLDRARIAYSIGD
jgi:S1-C subfamily serine protease